MPERSRTRRRLHLDEVGSTNAVALDAARAGDPGGLWVTAGRQTAGRGRRGRVWVSEAGNLYASLVLIDPASPADALNLPLVVALGVRNAIAALPGADPGAVRIKWPNDVLLGGRKAVGILLESTRLTDGRMAIVAGCGVNVRHVPADVPYPVTSLAREGIAAGVEAVFEAVAGGVEAAIAVWRRGASFAEVRRSWLSHAVGLGEPCQVRLPDGALDGVFESLDPSGRLILRLPGGAARAVSAGELFLSRIAAPAMATDGDGIDDRARQPFN